MFRSLLVHVLALAGVALGLLARTAESGGEQLARAEHTAATRVAGRDLEPGEAVYVAERGAVAPVACAVVLSASSVPARPSRCEQQRATHSLGSGDVLD